MNLDFVLVWEPNAPLHFRALTTEAEAFFKRSRRCWEAVAAFWWLYREETKDACTVVSLAGDLEKALRTVTGTKEISVRPVTPSVREVGRTKDPITGDVTCRMVGTLVDLRG